MNLDYETADALAKHLRHLKATTMSGVRVADKAAAVLRRIGGHDGRLAGHSCPEIDPNTFTPEEVVSLRAWMGEVWLELRSIHDVGKRLEQLICQAESLWSAADLCRHTIEYEEPQS